MRRLHKFLDEIGAEILFVYKKDGRIVSAQVRDVTPDLKTMTLIQLGTTASGSVINNTVVFDRNRDVHEIVGLVLMAGQVVSELAVKMEMAISEFGERATMAAKMGSPFDGQGVDFG